LNPNYALEEFGALNVYFVIKSPEGA